MGDENVPLVPLMLHWKTGQRDRQTDRQTTERHQTNALYAYRYRRGRRHNVPFAAQHRNGSGSNSTSSICVKTNPKKIEPVEFEPIGEQTGNV